MSRLSEKLPPPSPALARVKAGQLASWLGVKAQTLYAWSRDHKLPPPITAGPRTHLYDLESVRQALRRMEEEEATAREEVCLG